MGSYVYFESISLCVGEATLRTAEKLFSGVSQHVFLKISRLCARVGALLATERFFSGMNQHVALEINSLFGREIAKCASERLLTTMNQHMAFQYARSIACVVALFAIVALLSIIQRLLLGTFTFLCISMPFFQRSDSVRGCRTTESKITLQKGKSYESESFVVQNC